ncbi:MAG: ERF family protein [Clostridiales bacterium]|nr:ERF family protein [Clostridiales bacterium]
MNIYQAIHGVMNEVGAIGKNRKNQQQGFMYRGVDEVMNALQPAFVNHNIFVVPEVLEQTREERTTKNGGQLLYSILKVKFTFYADDGSNVSATVVGEGMDSADKASNKAMSVAFKYACFQVFCIPTEEMVDPDSETPPQSTQKPIRQAYDNGPPAAPPPPPAQQSDKGTVTEKSIRTQQLERLISGTKHTLDEANIVAQKAYGAANYDALAIPQYNDLYDRLEKKIKQERGNG